MINNEFKYLTISNDDSNWGLYINVAGTAKVIPNTSYPSPKHPSEYFFYMGKRKDFSGKPIAKIIEAARFEMRQNMEEENDLKTLAKKHNVSYSFFRKMFKKKEGVTPLHFRYK